MIELDTDELIGLVRLAGSWRAFAGYAGEWILDYMRDDPTFRPEDWGEPTPRTSLIAVTTDDGEAFCHAMEERAITAREMKQLITIHGQRRLTPTFLVD